MNIPHHLAINLYYMLQALRKEPVRRVCSELMESQSFEKKKLEKIQWQRLNRLLSYAGKNTLYYKKIFNRIGLSYENDLTVQEFKRIPLLKKSQIQRHIDEFISKDPKIRPHTLASTSGSSGEPLKIYRDNESWAHLHGNIMRGLSWHGILPGSHYAMIGGIGTGVKNKMTGYLKDIIHNRIHLYAVDMQKEKCKKFLENVKKFRPLYFYGYPSAIYDLACIMEEISIDLPTGVPKIIVTHGEELEGYQKLKIEEAFKCKVVNSYGCAEVGLIGFECEYGGLHIPLESVFVEVVDDEIVVTDLHSFSFPMIRYKLGDSLVLNKESCACGRNLTVFSSLKGKLRQVVEFADGKRVHTVFFNSLFKELSHRGAPIEKYQIIRTDEHEFLINLKVWDKVNQGEIEFLRNNLTEQFGVKCSFKVKIVDEILRTAGGKFRAYLEKMEGDSVEKEN